MTNKRLFSAFQIGLMLLPGLFLLYLQKFWTWFAFPLPINGLEYLTLLLLLWWIIGLWKFNFPKPQFSSKWQWIAVGLFLMTATIATAKITLHLNQGRTVPLGIWKGWFMAPACYFLMLISSFRTKADLAKLIEVSIGLVAVNAGLMLLQFFTGVFSDIQATYDMRLVWPYLDPLSGLGTSGNYPALFLAPFVCMAWVSLWNAKESLDKAYYGGALWIMLMAIYFTKSYGAWVAILGACALMSFVVSDGKKRWVTVPLITLVLLGGLYIDQKNTEKFQYATDTQEENVIGSGEERLNIWSVTWDLIKREPFWGIGTGQFQTAFQQQSPFTLSREVARKEINHALHPHNTFMMFWVSNGLLNVLAFIFLIVIWFAPLPKQWRWYLWTPLLYYLAHGLIDVWYWKNDLAYSFWFFGALATIAQNLSLVSGKVEHGLKIGRELGFPTANIKLDLELDKPHGVYAVILKIEKQKKKGVLYYGPRKTEGLPETIVCEVTIFDFDEDIYGKDITFKIGKFIREPMQFSSAEQLRKQIEEDVLIARNIKH